MNPNNMRMIGNILRRAMPASAGIIRVAALASFIAGCSSIPPPHVAPPLVVSDPLPAPVPEFIIAAGMLDTWNAVGQILVHVDGLTYHSRAQMLGLYELSFRGERFLILTRAQVIASPAQGVSTKVRAVLEDGKPNGSAAAIELLGLLQTRLPDELARIAAGKNKSRKR